MPSTIYDSFVSDRTDQRFARAVSHKMIFESRRPKEQTQAYLSGAQFEVRRLYDSFFRAAAAVH